MDPNDTSKDRIRPSSSLSVPGKPQRKKVVLEPGHSPLDWASLNQKTPKHILRGVAPDVPPPQYVRVTKDELKKHKTKDDCWTSINGKVFNITPYIHFHPGGVDEIMKCAGRDGTALFNKYHSWVNADRMLENCMVGVIART
ncbi:cytochrome b5-like heme/steroid binding domain-containing protein [Scheffersomyces xylosifermentans]|uniref:cytochrome b5-like heme/steroid binding domain-containing protein n=1 Tax=Scheffersomyces xylosifermentans TaxID=1304137 RepID=UPI00315DEB70